jgi:transglutaminase-like putative cysteine protease
LPIWRGSSLRTGKSHLIGSDASHAWIVLYVTQLGWTGFYATNNVIPGTAHMRIAPGRNSQLLLDAEIPLH